MSQPLVLRGICLLALVVSLGCGDDSTLGTTDGGSGSGLGASKRVVDLSSAEVSQLCSWGVAAAGGPGVTTTCSSGDVTTQTVADCETSMGSVTASCTATVGQVEACMEAIGADACSISTSPACQPIFACASAAP